MKKVLGILLFAVFAVLSGEDAPFVWRLERTGDSLQVTAEVKEGFYLSPGTVHLTSVPAVHWEAPAPESVRGEKRYPAGIWVWKASLPERLPVQISADFQGCSLDGICLLPESALLTESGGGNPEVSPESATKLPPFRVLRKLEGTANVPEFLAFLQGDTPIPARVSWLGMVLLAFFGGILLNFTPCVLPLIPINLSILGAGSYGKGGKGFVQASFYGLGMMTACGTLGILAVLTGARFGTLHSSPWFNFAVSGIFLVLALSVLEVVSLDFSRFLARLPVPEKKKNGRMSLPAAFFLGATAALLAGACVAPVLTAVLVWSAKVYSDGNPAGLLLPFILGSGMALPWPLAGAGLAVLPKPGAWMKNIKLLFALLILLAAGYYFLTGFSLLPERIREKEEDFARLARALDTGKTVLIDFRASWCKNCLEMERTTLRDPAVQAALSKMEAVPFRAENLSDPKIKNLLDQCGVSGLPAFVIVRKEPVPAETPPENADQ